MRAEVEPVTLRLRDPLRTATGEITERRLLLLRVEDRDGRVGWGEASALERYDGDTALLSGGAAVAARTLVWTESA